MTVQKFAKLFDTPETQILIKLDDPDGEVKVQVFFSPVGFGICTIAYSFGDSDLDLSWERAQKWFDDFDEAAAIVVYKDATSTLLEAGVDKLISRVDD